jgi:hypothetical protein
MKRRLEVAKIPWWLVPRKVFCSQRHVVLYDSSSRRVDDMAVALAQTREASWLVLPCHAGRAHGYQGRVRFFVRTSKSRAPPITPKS